MVNQLRIDLKIIGTQWWQIVYCNLPLIDLGSGGGISTGMGSDVSSGLSITDFE